MHYGVGGNLSRPAHTTPSYGYDAVKRLSAITWGIVGSQYTYDTLSRLSKLTTTRSGANMAVTALTYNSLGGLKTDGTWSYTWEHGRRFAGMSKTGSAISYAFNPRFHLANNPALVGVVRFCRCGISCCHLGDVLLEKESRRARAVVAHNIAGNI